MVFSQQKTTSTFEDTDKYSQDHAKRNFLISLTIDIVYTLIRIILLLVLFFLLLTIDLPSFKTSNSYKRMQQNLSLWQKQIIIDFQVTNAYNCPQGYEEYTNSSWPGNIQGCLCSLNIGLYDYDVVLQGECSQAQFRKGCLNVAAHKSIRYTYWLQDAHLCIKRLKNYNFYSSHRDIINPYNYSVKNCSKGGQYQIDLISPINCPVTNVSKEDIGHQSLDLFNYSYTREDDYPIVQFRISEYDFCQDLSQYDISLGRKFNYILQTEEKHQCEKKDKRTVLLDSLPETVLLGNNPRIYDIVNFLPNYPHIDSIYLYRLGFLRYPAWKYTCRISDNFDLQTATQYINLSELTSFHRSTSVTILVILTLQLLYLFYYWFDSYFYMKSKYLMGYLYLKDYQIRKINKRTNIGRDHQSELMKFIVVEVFLLIVLVIFAVIYSKTTNTQNWFKESYKCTDNTMKQYLQEYQLFFGSALTYSMACIFITMSVNILDVIYFIWRKCKGDLQNESKNQPIEDISEDVSDSMNQKDQKQLGNGKSNLMKVTQQCLIANNHDLTQQNSSFYQNQVFFQIEQQQNPPLKTTKHINQIMNRSNQISQSFYSQQLDSDKSD